MVSSGSTRRVCRPWAASSASDVLTVSSRYGSHHLACRLNRVTVRAVSPNHVVQKICRSYIWVLVGADKSDVHSCLPCKVQNHSSLLRDGETGPKRKLDFWEVIQIRWLLCGDQYFSPKSTSSTLSGLFCAGLWGPIGSCSVRQFVSSLFTLCDVNAARQKDSETA